MFLNMKSDRVHFVNTKKKVSHSVLIERGDQKKLRLEINKFFYWRKPNYIFGAAVLITLSIYFYCLFKKILEIIL